MAKLKNIKHKIGFLAIVFVFGLFLFSSIAIAQSYGDYANVAQIDNSISVRQISFWEHLFSGQIFAIATQKDRAYVGDFKPSETVNFHIDAISWNVMCSNMFVVAEIYVGSPSGTFIKAVSQNIGGQSGGNNYYIADVPYTISSSETRYGGWSAAGYLWCSDTNLPDIDGNGRRGQGERISNGYETTFNVINPNQNQCTAGYIGGTTCRSSLPTTSGNGEDSYKLYRKADCTSEYRRVQQCSSSQLCSGGACTGGGEQPPPSTCTNDPYCMAENMFQCSGDLIYQLCHKGTDGCFHWSSDTNCPTGQECSYEHLKCEIPSTPPPIYEQNITCQDCDGTYYQFIGMACPDLSCGGNETNQTQTCPNGYTWCTSAKGCLLNAVTCGAGGIGGISILDWINANLATFAIIIFAIVITIAVVAGLLAGKSKVKRRR